MRKFLPAGIFELAIDALRFAQGASIARVRSDLLEFPTGSLPVIRDSKPTSRK
jgi:hypothetical protein